MPWILMHALTLSLAFKSFTVQLIRGYRYFLIPVTKHMGFDFTRLTQKVTYLSTLSSFGYLSSNILSLSCTHCDSSPFLRIHVRVCFCIDITVLPGSIPTEYLLKIMTIACTEKRWNHLELIVKKIRSSPVLYWAHRSANPAGQGKHPKLEVRDDNVSTCSVTK